MVVTYSKAPCLNLRHMTHVYHAAGLLNVARSAFSCSMRFPNMVMFMGNTCVWTCLAVRSSFDNSRDMSAGHITLISHTLICFTRLQSGFSAGATSLFLAGWLVRILVSALYFTLFLPFCFSYTIDHLFCLENLVAYSCHYEKSIWN
jgi:hypothetical protein